MRCDGGSGSSSSGGSGGGGRGGSSGGGSGGGSGGSSTAAAPAVAVSALPLPPQQLKQRSFLSGGSGIGRYCGRGSASLCSALQRNVGQQLKSEVCHFVSHSEMEITNARRLAQENEGNKCKVSRGVVQKG